MSLISKTFLSRLSHPYSLSIILGVSFFSLYVSTASPVNVSYADSDLLTTIGYHLGVAHPPGYPLYILLVYLFTHIPIKFTIAFKAHLLSSLLQAASLSFLFLACINYLNFRSPNSKKCTIILISFISTSFLGISFLYWLYGSIAEKYPLNNLFIAIIIFLISQIFVAKTRRKYFFSWLFAILGLALNHHHTVLLIIPAIILVVWRYRQEVKSKQTINLGIFFVFLAIPVLLLIYLNSRQVPVSWHFSTDLNGLYRMLTRRDLSGYMVIQDRYRGIYLNNVSVSEIITKIPIYTQTLIQQFGLLPIFLLSLGSWTLFRQRNRLSKTLFIIFLSTTIFIPLYVDWPSDLSTQAIRIRMYLAGYVIFPLFFAAGIDYLLQKLTKPFIPKSILFLGFFFFLTHRIVTIHPQVDLKNFTYTYRFYAHVLDTLPQNTLLACTSDVACFGTLYLQQIEGIRPDITVLPHAINIVKNQLEQIPDIKGFDYPDNPEDHLDYLTWNLNKRPVYVIELQQLYHRLLGFEYGFLHYLPDSYTGQVAKEIPNQLPHPDYSFSNQAISLYTPELDHTRLQIKASLAQKHLLNAQTYARLRQPVSLIDQELEYAEKLSHSLPESYRSQPNLIRHQISQVSGYSLYLDKNTPLTPKNILNQAQIYQQNKKDQLAYLGYLGLVNRNPTDPEFRLYLAKFLISKDLDLLARQELENILRLYPEHINAQNLLDATFPERRNQQPQTPGSPSSPPLLLPSDTPTLRHSDTPIL